LSDDQDILREVESETCRTRSIGCTSTRSEKVRKRFCIRMQFFIANGGSCNYDVERIGDIDFPLRYRHLVQRWVPKELPEVYMDFFISGRMYCIAPSSLHGLGLFSMDGIKVGYGTVTELMEYVGPLYKYNHWLMLVSYMRSMQRYEVAANYIQLVDNNQNKGASMYSDGRPKATGNNVGFTNSTRLVATTKKLNCIFEGREGNRIFVCAAKTIVPGEELFIYYNLNRIDGGSAIMGVNILHTIQLNL
jgi:hypothetical protein